MTTQPEDLPEDWTPEQRALYLRLSVFLVENRGALFPPHTDAPPGDVWAPAAERIAALAAFMLEDDGGSIVIEDSKGRVVAQETRERTIQ